MKKIITGALISMMSLTMHAQTDSVLLFVSHEQTYYSEFIVMKEALETSGYFVDVRNASGMETSIYMIPETTDIEETANTLPGSDYADFIAQFEDSFGGPWDASQNETPAFTDVNGRIQDVINMDAYQALIVVGGIGAVDYRVDGEYDSQGEGPRLLVAGEVQAAAEKLNELALDALEDGKPVMAQCHGASIPAFWRIPETSGPGEEALGFSLIKDHTATGFPEVETPITLAGLNITHRPNDRVTITSPHEAYEFSDKGAFKILTTRDWYPQTIAHAARSLLNIIESYPSQAEIMEEVSVLILHGGAVDSLDCGHENILNDVPCNYPGVENLPADFRHIRNLLNSTSPNDNFNFLVSEQNISDEMLPFDPESEGNIYDYLSLYDVVIFFKHWSFGVTESLQTALVNYADDGGGVMALHHGLYNDIRPEFNKDVLVNELFGVQSHEEGWGASLTTYNFYATNYGHFISTYGIQLTDDNASAPDSWWVNPPLLGSNTSFSYYPVFPVYDEIYTNMQFVDGQTYGRDVNDVFPLFANDFSPAADLTHTTGFVKRFDANEDENVGRAAYFEAGERKENYEIDSFFGQVIRNSVVWLGNKTATIIEDSTGDAGIKALAKTNAFQISIYPNPANNELHILNADTNNPIPAVRLDNQVGQVLTSQRTIVTSNVMLDLSELKAGVYYVHIELENGSTVEKVIKN